MNRITAIIINNIQKYPKLKKCDILLIPHKKTIMNVGNSVSVLINKKILFRKNRPTATTVTILHAAIIAPIDVCGNCGSRLYNSESVGNSETL